MMDVTTSADSFDLSPLACPGLFYATTSGDGILSRIRTPGGLVTSAQCALIADIADEFASGVVTVTNRANLQLRALEDRLPADILRRLQEDGLASTMPTVDHLRNVMASPTAGLDAAAAADTRPLVRALDRYITASPHLSPLPAKVSVGIDGGERASIAGLPNDILFRASRDASGTARFRVLLRVGQDDGAWSDLGLTFDADDVVPVTAVLAEQYLTWLPADGSKPRLRHLLAHHDLEALQWTVLDRVAATQADAPSPAIIRAYEMGQAPIGVHAQPADDLTYLGLVPFVAGRFSGEHLRRIAVLAERYGSGSIRLSPWRNVLIPDVPRASVEALQVDLEAAGLACRSPSLASGIVACAGRAGCESGTVDTVRDAEALSLRLSGRSSTRTPLNIHFTGCDKCCAQRRQADITLLGRPGNDGRYDLYVGGGGDPRLGRLLLGDLEVDEALATVERLVVRFEEERRSGRPYVPESG